MSLAAVLLASRDAAESIKTVVQRLESNGECLSGMVRSLNRGERYQVKCIMGEVRRYALLCRATPQIRALGCARDRGGDEGRCEITSY